MNAAIADSSFLGYAARGGWACPIFIEVCVVAGAFLLFRAWRSLRRCCDCTDARYTHPRL